jgi:hypothetical protein
MRIKRQLLVGLFAFLAFAVSTASAKAAVVLTFEGLNDQEQILDFYNGGTGSQGSSGPNLGIGFGDSALALIDADAGGSGNFANEPSADTIAFFLSSGNLIMNVAAGFDTGFSFFYTSSQNGSVTVYDGLNGTGNILGVVNFDTNFTDNNCVGDPTGGFCHWDPVGVAFAGTAFSVSFAGGANQTGFDDITIGSQTPGPVPEPATLFLLGSGLAVIAARRARRKNT